MINLINGDCLEKMKDIEDKSIDLIFCDLPWGKATTCKWDIALDYEKFWIQIKRIRKDNTPIFFCTNTKCGIDLINSNRKEFRYDLIWVKSCPVGFLNARKMPMKKHEMIYVFYKRLPFYDLSSHEHKFVKNRTNKKNGLYGGKTKKKMSKKGNTHRNCQHQL